MSELKGCLIMAANSLGNPRDIPPRTLALLAQADLLVFEEDRGARLLLKHAGLFRDYLKLTEHAEKVTVEEVTAALRDGKTVLYASDQGTPHFADPGRLLLEVAYRTKAKVLVVPGPNAVTATISACPFDMSQFIYLGFPPRETRERESFFAALGQEARAVVLMDTPYRLKKLADDLKQLKPSRRVFVALDISGESEQYFVVKSSQVRFSDELIAAKLNYVLVIEGLKKAQ